MATKEWKKKIMYVLGGSIFTEDFFWKNSRFFLTIFILLVLYISNRYCCIQKKAEIGRLQHELKDAQYKALSISTDLTGRSSEFELRKKIEQKGIDLQALKTPLYKIGR